MNWIIRKSKKLPYHTLLKAIFEPLKDEIDNYKWIVSDLEFMTTGADGLPLNMVEDYFILDATQFKQIVDRPFLQIYWGAIVGVPIGIDIKLDEQNIPYVEGNPLVFKNGNIQYPDAEIEIICFDSSYTIAKFTKENLSEKFKGYFEEAIELEKFK